MLKNIDDILHDLIDHWIELKFCVHDEIGSCQIIYGQMKELHSGLIVMNLLTETSEPFYLNRRIIAIVSIIDLGSEKPSINEKLRMSI